MDYPERTGGAVTLRLDETRVKEQIKRIQNFVWARHVDGSDKYDHSIDEQEALRTLDGFYSEIGNRNSRDQVYLGILLFEHAFELPEAEQSAYFERARKIFNFYKKVTGENDWAAVEDRLEDINSFFGDDEEEAVAEAEPEQAEDAPEATESESADATAVVEAEAPVVEEPVVEPVAEESGVGVLEETLEESITVPEKAAEKRKPAQTPAQTVEEPVAVVETAKAPAGKAKPAAQEDSSAATATLESAAEEEERRKAEERAARREATEAFVADLEVVEGMQLIPAGTAVYGTEDREIFLDSFYIDSTPVTNAQYARFVQEMGYRATRFGNDPRFNQPAQPVVGVSLGDARQFARWSGKDLPTEQQWEKAARGTDGRAYPWGNDPPGASDASFGQDPLEGGPAAVGRSLRNVSPFGVKDMAGGVWEWTASRFATDSEFQVVRGGSYNDPVDLLEVTFRLEAHPKDKSEVIGFRCVKNIHH